MILQRLLLVLSIVLAALALVTLLPSGRIVSDLGYKTWCSFAPWSTLILGIPAWLAWAVRKYLKSLPG